MTRQATLNEILDSRERRAAKQKELLSRFGTPLVSYTMNIPGAEKDSPLIRAGFTLGLRRLLHAIDCFEDPAGDTCADGASVTEKVPSASALRLKHCEIRHSVTGPEAYLCVDMDPQELKKITVSLEEADPLGRLFDMDVLAQGAVLSDAAASNLTGTETVAQGAVLSDAAALNLTGTETVAQGVALTDAAATVQSSAIITISRSDLGLPMRKCLLCDEPAKACRRAGAHTPEELHKAVFTILSEALSKALADLACDALRAELDATPKPGLVDRYNNGSHKDMNYSTFCRSIGSLRPYFTAAARLGMRYPGFPAPASEATAAGISTATSATNASTLTFAAAITAPGVSAVAFGASSAANASAATSAAAITAPGASAVAFGASSAANASTATSATNASTPTSATVAPDRTFQKLRALGKTAEADMLAATGGVNTHKGAIFSMGLAVCAAARVLSGTAPEPLDFSDIASSVLDECARLTNGLCARDFAGVTAENAATAGEKLYARFGIKGIRGQAEEGYPAVRFAGLPVYESVLRAFAPTPASASETSANTPASASETFAPAAANAITKNAAACTALLAILCHAADTNLIKRGGLEKAEEVTGRIHRLLYGETPAEHFSSIAENNRPGSAHAAPAKLHVPTESELLLLDMDFIRGDLSPGGSADLLALTIFLSDLGRRFGIAGNDADPSAETPAGSKTGA